MCVKLRSYPDAINENTLGLYSIFLYVADDKETKEDDVRGWDLVGHIGWSIYKSPAKEKKVAGRITRFGVKPHYRSQAWGSRLFHDALCHMQQCKKMLNVIVFDLSSQGTHTQNYYAQFGLQESRPFVKEGNIETVRAKINAYLEGKGCKPTNEYYLCPIESVKALV